MGWDPPPAGGTSTDRSGRGSGDRQAGGVTGPASRSHGVTSARNEPNAPRATDKATASTRTFFFHLRSGTRPRQSPRAPNPADSSASLKTPRPPWPPARARTDDHGSARGAPPTPAQPSSALRQTGPARAAFPRIVRVRQRADLPVGPRAGGVEKVTRTNSILGNTHHQQPARRPQTGIDSFPSFSRPPSPQVDRGPPPPKKRIGAPAHPASSLLPETLLPPGRNQDARRAIDEVARPDPIATKTAQLPSPHPLSPSPQTHTLPSPPKPPHPEPSAAYCGKNRDCEGHTFVI